MTSLPTPEPGRGRRSGNEGVGAYDAKTRFGQLLSEVEEHGVSITITRRGVPIARLVPVANGSTRSTEQILREFDEFRDAHPLDGVTPRDLIDVGRKK